MKIIETEIKLREARKLCFKMAEEYADYFLIQDGDEIYFTTAELKEMGRKTILDLVEEDYDHCSTCMIYLKHDLRNTGDNLTWLIEHPFLIKNLPEVYWPDYGDLPYLKFDWSNRNYKEYYTGNQTHPYKFDCNIKNFRRIFLRQIFTPWHDGNNTCTIEEYCLKHYKPCIDYIKDIRETNDIEEIISYYQETEPSYRFCKLYDENKYYVYPKIIKKYIEWGFLSGIEEIEELKIMINNSEEELRKALVDRIEKLMFLLENTIDKRCKVENRIQNNKDILTNYTDYSLTYLFFQDSIDTKNLELCKLEEENCRLQFTLRALTIKEADIKYMLQCCIVLQSKPIDTLLLTVSQNEEIDTLFISNDLENISMTNKIIQKTMEKLYAAKDKVRILEHKIKFLKEKNEEIILSVLSEIIYEEKYITEVNKLSEKIVNDIIKNVIFINTPIDIDSDIESETLSIKSLSEIEEDILIVEKKEEKVYIEKDTELLEAIEKQEIFDSYCIVYSKSKKRLENFHSCKQAIPDLIYREAVDSVNNYELYKNIAIDNNLLTKEYIESKTYYKGKLGCNLSHIYLLDDFVKNENSTEWILVLEDDVEINRYNIEKYIHWLIDIANKNNTHYIQLYTNENFLEEQKKSKKVNKNLYHMIPQWGTVAYMISKTGAKKIIENLPLEDNIDGIYSKHISTLRSLCYLNEIFINKGDVDASKQGEFGSIIWGTE